MPSAAQLEKFAEFIRGVLWRAGKKLSSEDYYASLITNPGTYMIGRTLYTHVKNVHDGQGNIYGRVLKDKSGRAVIVDNDNNIRA